MTKVSQIAGLAAILFFSATGFADEFSPDSIKNLMKKVATWGFGKHWKDEAQAGAPYILDDWSRGAFMTGVMGTYKVTQEKQWLDSVDKWGAAHSWNWEGGSANDYCCLQTYCERYIVDPKPENVSKYQPSQTVVETKMKSSVERLWEWEDVLYMGPPVFAMIGNITGRTACYDSMLSAWGGSEKRFFDPNYFLFWWDPSFVNSKTSKGYPKLWGPGNAWVIGGWIRSLKYMPDSYAPKAAWAARFKRFCDTIRVKQQPDGMWRTSLYEPTEYPDPEASCTSFFIYAMALGVKMGLLKAEIYIPVIRKAWTPLTRCVDAVGMVTKCQPWSLAPGPVGTNNTPEGQGAFMLAAEGVYTVLDLLTTGVIYANSERKRAALLNTCRKILPGASIDVPRGVHSINIFEVNGKINCRYTVQNTDQSFRFSLPTATNRKAVYILKFE